MYENKTGKPIYINSREEPVPPGDVHAAELVMDVAPISNKKAEALIAQYPALGKVIVKIGEDQEPTSSGQQSAASDTATTASSDQQDAGDKAGAPVEAATTATAPPAESQGSAGDAPQRPATPAEIDSTRSLRRAR